MTSKAPKCPNSTILKSVSKPGRYAGGEYGQILKNKTDIKARFAFCFPDTYEIGMSNLGVRLLYGALNEHPDIWCERVYDPWVDMQDKMREHQLSLTALESGCSTDVSITSLSVFSLLTKGAFRYILLFSRLSVSFLLKYNFRLLFGI
jgi:hypothetical protein